MKITQKIIIALALIAAIILASFKMQAMGLTDAEIKAINESELQATIANTRPQPAPDADLEAVLKLSIATQAQDEARRKQTQSAPSRPAPKRPAPAKQAVPAKKPSDQQVAQRLADEELARKKQLESDARIARDLAERERKEQSAKPITHVFKHGTSVGQEGLDCGFYALANATVGTVAIQYQWPNVLKTWKESLTKIKRKNTDLDDQDIKYLANKFGLSLDKYPMTIIPNMEQLSPIKATGNFNAYVTQNWVDVMQKLQTQPKVHHSFIVGYERMIPKGHARHWITVIVEKENNTVTWTIQDSLNDNKKEAEAMARKLAAFMMQSDSQKTKAIFQRDF